MKTKLCVAPLLDHIKDKNSVRFGDQEKANILQKQFSSVFVHEPNGEIPKLNTRTNTPSGGQLAYNKRDG